MEGWLLTPGMGFKPLRNTLPRLRRFLMAGQWVMPGGGLPSGLMTARLAVRTLCKEDRIPFLTDPAALSRAAEARRQAMHILIVDGHPDRNEQRFCHALAAAYAEGARQSGHDVRVIIIASINIPFLRSQDEWMHGTLPPQLREPQAAVKWADHLVIIYPLWLGDVPAYLKAFLEQIDRTSRSRRARRTQPQDH